MNIMASPNPTQLPTSNSFASPRTATQAGTGNDPMSGLGAMMGMCMQCMAQMMQLLAMTMGNQGMASGGGDFGGSQATPGVDGFLGGGGGGGSSASPGGGIPASSGGSGEASSASGSSGATGQSEPSPDWAQKLPEPMRHLGPAFEKYGKQYKLDPRFLAAISMLETGSGTSKAFKNKNNAMGVSDSKGPIGFGSADQSIERMARVLASDTGPYKGARTIAEIGKIYAPPGAGNDPNGTNGHWPSGVSKFYQQLGGDPTKPVK